MFSRRFNNQAGKGVPAHLPEIQALLSNARTFQAST